MHPLDHITDQIIAAAIEVHKKFGPGLLESVYTNALGADLVARDFDVHISKPVSLDHEGLHVHRAFVIDLLVDEKVIVENVPLLKHGIRRVVNRHVDEDGNKLPVTRPERVDEVKKRIDDDH